MMPKILDINQTDFDSKFQTLLSAIPEDSPEVKDIVTQIIADVRKRGDASVIELTSKFDQLYLTPETLAFSQKEILDNCALAPQAERTALELAAKRIKAYHTRQLPEDLQWTDTTGVTLGWRWTPVSAAGLYVPGGQASYPSSVLMNAIPARIAGVQRLAICVPIA